MPRADILQFVSTKFGGLSPSLGMLAEMYAQSKLHFTAPDCQCGALFGECLRMLLVIRRSAAVA